MVDSVQAASTALIQQEDSLSPPAKRTRPDSSNVDDGLESLLVVPESFFSISLHPLLLDEIPGNLRTGCVVTTRIPQTGEGSKSTVCVRDRIRMAWRILLERAKKTGTEKLLREVEYLLSMRTDDSVEILEACKKLSSATTSIAGAEEGDWLFPLKSPLRKYAFLRRLAMAMYHSRDGGEIFDTLDVSFLDLLLDQPDIKDLGSRLLNLRLGEIEEEIGSTRRTDSEVTHLRQLARMIARALERAGCPVAPDASTKKEFFRQTYVVPERTRQDHETVVSECERLIRELDERKNLKSKSEICHYTVGGKIKLPYRIRNGTLLVTEKELSYEEFVSQKKVMEKVNKKLQRKFFAGISRPKMHKCSISNEALSQLRSIFFNDRGCLRKSIVNDIDMSTKHGYINFANASCRDVRNDYRWQVPLRQHSALKNVPTRALVEALLAEHGCIHPDYEVIHDLGILIGGTEDQSIHHDIPRQTTSWLPEDPETSEKDFVGVPVNGWEYDRAAYNEAMACPYAPSSVLLGMGDSGTIQVGVQKNQIDRNGCPAGWCRIVDGKEGEQFRIVRENYYLVVLEANPGAMFTGDFQHAGVRNFAVNSPEDKLMTKFFDRVESIVEEVRGDDDDEGAGGGATHDVTGEMIKMMCNFPNLHKISRFHCSTEPKAGPLRIPRNTVGFVDCRPNPPADDAKDGNQDDADEDEQMVTDDYARRKSSVVVETVPATIAAPCPICGAMVQCPNQESLDQTLSLHMAVCLNSRTSFRRAASHQEHYDE